MDQGVFTQCETQSASYDYRFRSLNSYNYYQKEELCLRQLLPSFLPSVCPPVLRQLRHNGALVIAGRGVNGNHWAFSRSLPVPALGLAQAEPSTENAVSLSYGFVLSWQTSCAASAAASPDGPAQGRNNLASIPYWAAEIKAQIRSGGWKPRCSGGLGVPVSKPGGKYRRKAAALLGRQHPRPKGGAETPGEPCSRHQQPLLSLCEQQQKTVKINRKRGSLVLNSRLKIAAVGNTLVPAVPLSCPGRGSLYCALPPEAVLVYKRWVQEQMLWSRLTLPEALSRMPMLWPFQKKIFRFFFHWG